MQLHLAITKKNHGDLREAIDDPQDCMAPLKETLAEFGCELIDWCYAPTDQRRFILVLGDMEDLMANSMVIRSSGLFGHVSFPPLFSVKEAQDAMVKADALASEFDALNHNKIDRMMLAKYEMARILLQVSFHGGGCREAVADPSEREITPHRIVTRSTKYRWMSDPLAKRASVCGLEAFTDTGRGCAKPSGGEIMSIAKATGESAAQSEPGLKKRQ